MDSCHMTAGRYRVTFVTHGNMFIERKTDIFSNSCFSAAADSKTHLFIGWGRNVLVFKDVSIKYLHG